MPEPKKTGTSPEFEMKSSSRPLRSRSWLAAVFLYIGALVVIYGSLLQTVSKVETGYAKHIISHAGTSNIAEHKLHFSSAGVSLTNQQATNENIERSLCSSRQNEKLIRPDIIEKERIVVLSVRLAWFMQATYRRTLPPLWLPSIPIAHGRLII